jgi:hypothetical protein
MSKGVKRAPIEAFKIFPHYPFMKFVMYVLFAPLKPALSGLDGKVSFLNIGESNDVFIISCDWCSICNGIVETARANIRRSPHLSTLVDFERLKIADGYLDFILCDRVDKVTQAQTVRWCQATFGDCTPDLLLFSRIYLKLEQIELRWCPFKRSKEMYYRNKDKRFLDPCYRMICEVGNILSKHEQITCNNCPRVVNEHWMRMNARDVSRTPSIFQPLLDYMIEEINRAWRLRKCTKQGYWVTCLTLHNPEWHKFPEWRVAQDSSDVSHIAQSCVARHCTKHILSSDVSQIAQSCMTRHSGNERNNLLEWRDTRLCNVCHVTRILCDT